LYINSQQRHHSPEQVAVGAVLEQQSGQQGAIRLGVRCEIGHPFPAFSVHCLCISDDTRKKLQMTNI